MFTPDTLTAEDFRLYRLARFGEAGHSGRKGVAQAGAFHGVQARTWYTYEQGTRRPARGELRRISSWLNRAARRLEAPAPALGASPAPSALAGVFPAPLSAFAPPAGPLEPSGDTSNTGSA